MLKVKNKTMMADFGLFIVALIWGAGFIAAKISLDYMNAYYILTFRFIGTGLIIGIIFLNRVLKIKKKEIVCASMLGICLFLAQSLQTIGLQYTEPGKQGFVFSSYTVMVPFFTWIINRKRPSMIAFLSGALTLIGIGFLSLNSTLTLGFGDTLTILSAATFSLLIVLTSRFAKGIDPIQLTVVQMLVAGILAYISTFIVNTPIKPIDTVGFISVFYIVVINTTVAYLLQNICQKYTTDTKASIIISLEALFGCMLSTFMLGEIFTPKMMLGAVIIFVAVMLSSVNPNVLKKNQRLSGDLASR